MQLLHKVLYCSDISRRSNNAPKVDGCGGAETPSGLGITVFIPRTVDHIHCRTSCAMCDLKGAPVHALTGDTAGIAENIPTPPAAC